MELEQALAEHFGHTQFRPGQRRTVEAVIEGREVLAVMPTGAGKSLCYQLPAAVLEGVTVVVSPLIALMKDQVDALAARGIPACAINSTLTQAEQRARIDELAEGRWKLVYVAPERFRHRAFVEALGRVPLALLAIDEAHCISEWGHDFRPDYAHLGEVRERLAPRRIAAFTATATPEVRDDIVRQLRFRTPDVEVHGFDRPNLHFAVERLSGKKEKRERTLAWLQAVREAHGRAASAIVYCATRKNVEEVTAFLTARGVACRGYHAGMGAERRRTEQDWFMSTEGSVVVATNAFGMGVDKADIRLVLHHDLPDSTEAYYQEAGRAGRDGAPALAVLLWSAGDKRLRELLLDASCPPPEAVVSVWERLQSRPGTTLAGPLSQLADRAGVGKGAAETALRILQAGGHLSTESLAEDQVRVRVHTPEVPWERLSVDLEALERHARLERARLGRMVEYASREQCRRRTLLTYFGDPDAPPEGARCAGCDVCERAEARSRGGDPAALELGRRRSVAALSLVAQNDGRFGRRKLLLALSGSRSQLLARTRLDEHPAFGAFAGTSQTVPEGVLDRLLAHGLLEVLGDEYPVVGITAEGMAVLGGRATLPDEIVGLAAPPAMPAAAGPRSGRPAPASSPGGRGSGEDGGGGEADPPLSPEERLLYRALKEKRKAWAEAAEVPAYVIFHDKHLRALSRARPGDREAFLAVPGMGPGRWDKWGEAVLEVVEEAGDPGP